ncbi:hypothetical protein E2C01_056428 [Portunus trituberculatus]|uniref:Uncharacterized protein n=1 Tax=Portunus trituberculatus TaxID=210409 RepID=A0A5B7H0I0_PORTR|nr:hypothetical protein [Portunus trituberculatus]
MTTRLRMRVQSPALDTLTMMMEPENGFSRGRKEDVGPSEGQIACLVPKMELYRKKKKKPM